MAFEKRRKTYSKAEEKEPATRDRDEEKSRGKDKEKSDGEFEFVGQLFPNKKGTAYIMFFRDKDDNEKTEALGVLTNITANDMLCITESKDGEKLNLSVLVRK